MTDLVKDLRKATGAGFEQCKAALRACGGDMDDAKQWLRWLGTTRHAQFAFQMYQKHVLPQPLDTSLEARKEQDLVIARFHGRACSQQLACEHADCESVRRMADHIRRLESFVGWVTGISIP